MTFLISAVFAASGMSILADTNSIPPLPPLAQYGLLGVAVMVLATGRIVVPTGWLKDEREARKRAEGRADRLEEELKRLNTAFQDKAIPALSDATTAVNRADDMVNRYIESATPKRRPSQ